MMWHYSASKFFNGIFLEDKMAYTTGNGTVTVQKIENTFRKIKKATIDNK